MARAKRQEPAKEPAVARESAPSRLWEVCNLLHLLGNLVVPFIFLSRERHDPELDEEQWCDYRSKNFVHWLSLANLAVDLHKDLVGRVSDDRAKDYEHRVRVLAHHVCSPDWCQVQRPGCLTDEEARRLREIQQDSRKLLAELATVPGAPKHDALALVQLKSVLDDLIQLLPEKADSWVTLSEIEVLQRRVLDPFWLKEAAAILERSGLVQYSEASRTYPIFDVREVEVEGVIKLRYTLQQVAGGEPLWGEFYYDDANHRGFNCCAREVLVGWRRLAHIYALPMSEDHATAAEEGDGSHSAPVAGGHPPDSIADELGCSVATVNKYAKAANVLTPSQGEKSFRYSNDGRLSIIEHAAKSAGTREIRKTASQILGKQKRNLHPI